MGLLENATKPTNADYNLHDVYLKAKQSHAQGGYLEQRYAAPHQLAFTLLVSEQIPLQTVHISTHLIVYTSYLNTLHYAQFRQCTVNVACPPYHLLSTGCSGS